MTEDLDRRIARSLSQVTAAGREDRAPRSAAARHRLLLHLRRRRTQTWAATTVAVAAVVVVTLVLSGRFTAPGAGGDRRSRPLLPATTTIDVSGHPFDLAVSGGLVWATDTDSGRLLRIEAASAAILDPIRIGGSPEDIDISDGIVWVSNPQEGTVMRFDEASGEPLGSQVNLGDGPVEIEMAAGNGTTWVLADEQELFVIDASTGFVERSLPLQASDIAVGDGAPWVLGIDGDLTEIDPGTGAVRRSVGSAGGDDLMVAGDALWVAHRSAGTLSAFSSATLEPIGTASFAGSYLDMAVGDGVIWVLSDAGGAGTLTGFSTSTLTPLGGTHVIEGDPRQIFESGGHIWITDPAEETILRMLPVEV